MAASGNPGGRGVPVATCPPPDGVGAVCAKFCTYKGACLGGSESIANRSNRSCIVGNGFDSEPAKIAIKWDLSQP
jgi:hypothetical protein